MPLSAIPTPLNDTTSDSALWRTSLGLGFAVLAFESAAAILYLAETWAVPGRGVLLTITCVVLVMSIAGALAGRASARRSWRLPFSYAATVAATVVLSLCAHLDRGLESPLLYLAVLPVTYAGLVFGPRRVKLCGAIALGGFVVVGLLDGDRELPQQSLLMFSALMIGVVALAVGVSRRRGAVEAERASLIAELRLRASTDALTGCWNQTTFHLRLQEEAARAQRHGRPLSLLVCDVDLFRQFNETHGHDGGDAALQDVGDRLRRCARADDLVARIGGDEFAILMPETSESEAAAVARRMIDTASEEGPRTASVSIGVAALASQDPAGRHLFRDADAAMYDAKSRGRGDVTVASSIEDETSANGLVALADGKRQLDLVRDARREQHYAELVLDTLVREAPVGFVLTDGDFRILRINPTLAAMSGATPEDLIGMRVPDAVPHLWDDLRGPFHRVVATGAPVRNVEVLGPDDDSDSPFGAALGNYFPIKIAEHVVGVGCIVVDISDRKRLDQSRETLTDAVIKALAAAAEVRDPYTAGHQNRVGKIATEIATELGYDAFTTRGIGIAASIHDIGKVGVPAEILSKPTKLTDAEMAIVRTHAQAGYEILRDIEFPWPVAEMVQQHHERLDGSGYPFGLRGDEISIGGRIIAVADVVEAVSAHRPYRAALGIDAAVSMIRDGAGTLFDPAVVDACLRVLDRMEASPHDTTRIETPHRSYTRTSERRRQTWSTRSESMA